MLAKLKFASSVSNGRSTGCREGGHVSKDQEIDRFRPRLALRFGITGHRPPRLKPEHHQHVREQCEDLFKLAVDTLKDIAGEHSDIFSNETARVALVSSLAEGADVIAAEAALTCGLDLAVCLPFPAGVYARDFGEPEWARTSAMLDQARTAMALADFKGGDEAAYELAGRIVLSQSDILIAVWDGEASRGRGGTTQVIAEAVALHQPVVHIDASGRSPPELLWSGLHDVVPDHPSLDGVERTDARTALPRLIYALCAPPVGEDAGHLDSFVQQHPDRRERHFAWPALLALTGAKKLRRTSFLPPKPGDSVRSLRGHVSGFVGLGRFGEQLTGPVARRFGRADAEAGYFALRFRSSFVANFALAGLAVMLALSGLLFPDAKKWLISAELLVILAIIINTRGANRSNLHQQWLNLRHLAERLRLLAMSSTLGQLSLRAVEDGTTHPGWVSWYARATARELGLVGATFDKSYLAEVRSAMLNLIDEQAEYHASNAHAMHHANHALHRTGDAFFLGTILACVAYLTVSIFVGKPGSLGPFGVTELVTFATALFPALAAALYGIRMQGDFAATSERSSVIARQLAQLRTAIERDPLTYERLIDRSRRLSDIMLAEIHQWRLHYETRPLSLPG